MSDAPQGNPIAERLTQAASLPETLTAALEAFEAIRITARSYQEQQSELFAAFMTAADAAVDGREALTSAPSTPPNGVAVTQVVPAAEEAGRAANSLAALAAVLARRLGQAASKAAQPGDHDACMEAAAAAGRVCELMTRADR